MLNQLEIAEMWSEAVLWFRPVVVQPSRRVFRPARVATWCAFVVALLHLGLSTTQLEQRPVVLRSWMHLPVDKLKGRGHVSAYPYPH